MKRMIIAIDGPSSAGKSTVAKLVAKELGIRYLNTGAMYRALAYLVRLNGIEPEDKKKVSELGDVAKVTVEYDGDIQNTFVNGVNVSDCIGSQSNGQDASTISTYKRVRAPLVREQRRYGRAFDLVADGRDMGTKVFPDAPFWFYLTAPDETRARWRAREKHGEDAPVHYAQVLEEVRKRDKQDMNRKHDPLPSEKEAKDLGAIVVQADQFDGAEAVSQFIAGIIKQSMAGEHRA